MFVTSRCFKASRVRACVGNVEFSMNLLSNNRVLQEQNWSIFPFLGQADTEELVRAVVNAKIKTYMRINSSRHNSLWFATGNIFYAHFKMTDDYRDGLELVHQQELLAKCRHENTFYATNFKPP